jgi:hypothetical protein
MRLRNDRPVAEFATGGALRRRRFSAARPMMRLATLLLVAASVVLPIAAARADCAMQIKDLKAKVERVTDRTKRAAVTKELNKTIMIGRGSETECLNGVTRTRRLLNAPDEAPVKPKEERAQVNWN